jgi:RNA 2',3'-cyclic 3'-phosphodiesterase
MATRTRVFLALNLPADVRRAVRTATGPMRVAAPDVNWVVEDNLHLTLKFLGPQPAAAVEALGDGLRPIVARNVPVALEVGGLGAFPSLRAPRVIWLGVAAESRLELLHHDIEAACAGLGYELEGRTFRPHITLGRARARSPVTPPIARSMASAARGIAYRARVDVASVEIMASEPATMGAVYRRLTSLPLSGGR